MDLDRIPKIELHCHLDGSMPAALIRKLSGNEAIPAEQLQVPQDCRSLSQYLERFALPLTCLQTESGLAESGYAILAEAAKENVRYMEVRFAPMLSVHEELSCRQVIESVLAGMKRGYQEHGVSYNIIVCAMRHHRPEQNLEMLKTARELLGEGVCALDLAGDEAAYETALFRELFFQARKWGMPFTIHSGECGSIQNVREAYELGAKRIGHGLTLKNDRELMKRFAADGIGVEMCPTSNLQTKAAENWAEYPLFEYLQAGIKVSVNTDNRTVSNTTMTGELQLIYDSCGGNQDILYRLLVNAAETSFAEDGVKNRLIEEMNAYF